MNVEELAKKIAARYGLFDYDDPYYFFYRICKNEKDYKKYGFGWEPFRDLAGPLKAG